MKFKVIYCDPPWSYHVYSGTGRSAANHYHTMTAEEIYGDRKSTRLNSSHL